MLRLNELSSKKNLISFEKSFQKLSVPHMVFYIWANFRFFLGFRFLCTDICNDKYETDVKSLKVKIC